MLLLLWFLKWCVLWTWFLVLVVAVPVLLWPWLGKQR
jgi:hypothetical protein